MEFLFVRILHQNDQPNYTTFIESTSTQQVINKNNELLMKAILPLPQLPPHPSNNNRPSNKRHISSISESSSQIIIPSTFSVTQKKLCQRIMNLKDKKQQILELLLGGPGTGKTFVSNFIRSLYGPNESIVAAPTGKAASHHDGGTTIQSCFALGIDIKRLKSVERGRLLLLAARFQTAQLIILDEISMIPAPLLSLISQRLQELMNNQLPFGGLNILMLGDFQQLDPVGGRSLMSAALDYSTSLFKLGDDLLYSDAGKLFRQFTLNILTEQQRSVDPYHTGMLRLLSDTNKTHPISSSILSSICHHCMSDIGNRLPNPNDHQSGHSNCPHRCPHRCQHLKELTQADVTQDSSWLHATMVSPLNCTVDAWTMEALKLFATRTGQPIIRWLLPDFSKKSAGSSKFMSNPILRLGIEENSTLWGYYVKDAPVIFGINLNTLIGIANGSQGVLHSLVGVSEDDINLYNRGQPGTIITLSTPPLAVNVKVMGLKHKDWIRKEIQKQQDGEDPIVSLLVNGNPSFKKELEVEIGKDGDGALKLKVLYPGYDLAFASTVHKVQGDTINKIIVDLNKNPSSGAMLDLPCLYVLLSRVKRACDLRVVPWIPSLGKDHLLRLQPNITYTRFMKSFDVSGRFNPANIPPAPVILPSKQKRKLSSGHLIQNMKRSKVSAKLDKGEHNKENINPNVIVRA